MTADEGQAGKYNIQFGQVSQSQVVVGDYNTVSQKIGLSPQETAHLRSLFGDLRTAVAAQAPPDQREAALSEAKDLEGAIVAEHPDPSRVRSALRWFRDNAPQLAGSVASLLVNPLVGKVVEAAGEVVAGQFREVVDEAAKT
jgi:hypothetical protein